MEKNINFADIEYPASLEKHTHVLVLLEYPQTHTLRHLVVFAPNIYLSYFQQLFSLGMSVRHFAFNQILHCTDVHYWDCLLH